jgi:hypothetical protein
MKQIKVMGLSLIVVFSVAALSSSPAMAATECKSNQVLYGETCETPAEHAKFLTFANCPFGTPPLEEGYTELVTCVGGESFYKEKWKNKAQAEEWEANFERAVPNLASHFTTGNITVALKAPITLRGGFEQNENSEEAELLWVGARGAATIQPVAQKGPSLKKSVNAALLSQSELERYDYYVKYAKETKTYATVELAGPAEQIHLNLIHQLTENGTAFVFPVKVKLTSPFVGENCYVGSDEHPIDVPFTTGQDGELHGKAGTLTFENNATIGTLWGDTLVSSSFSSPGVQGCGIEDGADAAIDSALGLPSATGTSVLNGVLKLSGAEEAEQGLKGEV